MARSRLDYRFAAYADEKAVVAALEKPSPKPIGFSSRHNLMDS